MLVPQTSAVVAAVGRWEDPIAKDCVADVASNLAVAEVPVRGSAARPTNRRTESAAAASDSVVLAESRCSVRPTRERTMPSTRSPRSRDEGRSAARAIAHPLGPQDNGRADRRSNQMAERSRGATVPGPGSRDLIGCLGDLGRSHRRSSRFAAATALRDRRPEPGCHREPRSAFATLRAAGQCVPGSHRAPPDRVRHQVQAQAERGKPHYRAQAG